MSIFFPDLQICEIYYTLSKNVRYVYEKQTKPLAEYYEKAGVIARIDGAVSPDKVFEQIENFVNNNVK